MMLSVFDLNFAFFESVALGIIVGILLATFGAGGSLILTPSLILIIGFPTQVASFMTLIIVAITSFFGLLPKIRNRAINLSLGIRLFIYGLPGTILGAYISNYISEEITLALLILIMAYAARLILKGPLKVRVHEKKLSIFVIVFIAEAVGCLTGLLGIGGGIVLVPTLIVFLGVPANVAAGTSLAVILMNSILSLFLRFNQFATMPVPEVLVITGGAVIATFAVAPFLSKVKAGILEKLLAFFLLGISVMTFVAGLFKFWL
jgi:uncharacterized membrane protein YfcA